MKDKKLIALNPIDLEDNEKIRQKAFELVKGNPFVCVWFDLKTKAYKWSYTGLSDEQIVYIAELIKKEALNDD